MTKSNLKKSDRTLKIQLWRHFTDVIALPSPQVLPN